MNLTGDRNQCRGCGEYFNSSNAFERHRTGEHGVNRRCLTPDEMLAKKMQKNSQGFWVGRPMSEAEKLRRRNAGRQTSNGEKVSQNAS